MKFEPALVIELKGLPGINGHVYPLNAPEKVRKTGAPYIIYSSSSGVATKTLGGFNGPREVNVELNVVTTTYEAMKPLSAQMVTLLENMEGRSIGTDGPYIQELVYFDPVEFFESEPQLYRCSIEINVFFEEVE